MSADAMPHNDHQTFTRAPATRVQLGAPTIESLDDVEFSGPGGGGGGIYKPFVDAAQDLPKGSTNIVRVPVAQTDDGATLRALTGLRRVIRDKLGKASDGNDLKCKALANGDIAIGWKGAFQR